MLRKILALLVLTSASLLALPSEATADDPPPPDLEVRTDRRAPWTAYRVGGDLLGIAWNRYRLDLEIGLGRYHGLRLEAGWKRGAARGPLTGLAYELWPQGRGVDGLFMALGGRAHVVLESQEESGHSRVDAFAELGYRHVWRGATIGVSLGVAHRWAVRGARERRILPVGSIGLGWAF